LLSRLRRQDADQTHVLILVQNLPVPFDRRVWQEAVALTAAGYRVHVICPATKEYPKRRETIQGVSIYRYAPRLEARRAVSYLAEYGIAITAQLRLALAIRWRHRVAVVQVCNPPDLLFLAVLPLVLLGSRLIYDHHDACPELMMAKGHRDGSIVVRAARSFERMTYRLASVAIETNESYRQIAVGRGGVSPGNVFVVRSAPAADRFAGALPDDRWRRGRKYLVAYVGVMGIQDGLDYLIDAAQVLIRERGQRDVQFIAVGTGPEFSRLLGRVRSLGLEEQVTFTGRISDQELGSVLKTADVCVNPDEASAMNDISTMNKVLEYMAVGKPVVQFDLREGRFSAGEASLYAACNDKVSLADCIRSLLEDQQARDRMGEFGRRRLTAELSWEAQVPVLLAAYQRALSCQPAASRRSSLGLPASRQVAACCAQPAQPKIASEVSEPADHANRASATALPEIPVPRGPGRASQPAASGRRHDRE
jgi:glycosyltransferase involved in cell wall biosynthesis